MMRVAIVGAGPAGFYAAGHLLETVGGTWLDGRLVDLIDRPVEVDMFERLPTPWGLVRGAVAPDHPEKKLISNVFDAIARRAGFRYFGNVDVGRDVHPDELAAWYDAVIYAVGCAADPPLDLPGAELSGCLSAREFVAWYSGHPDYADLRVDLSRHRAVVIGNGNVALDVARILAAPISHLEHTDVADHALDALRNSRVREVVVLGRRDHRHAAYNAPELEELAHIHGLDIIVQGVGDLETEPDDDHDSRRTDEILRRYQRRPAQSGRRIVLQFLTSPVEVLGSDHVSGIRLVSNRLEPDAQGVQRARATGEAYDLDTGLVLRATGYFGRPIQDLPFDARRGIIPNVDGRVHEMPGTYVTGWIKRGPKGIIGTNKKCARDTVRTLLNDAHAGRLPCPAALGADEVAVRLASRCPNLVTYDDWRCLDRLERSTGTAVGRPRVKLTRVEQMLAHLSQSHQEPR